MEFIETVNDYLVQGAQYIGYALFIFCLIMIIYGFIKLISIKFSENES